MASTGSPEPLRPARPCAVVIFGAAGDLTKRKLLPALYNLKAHGLLPRELAIVGVARKPMSHDQFRHEQSKDIAEFATMPVDQKLWADRRDTLYYQAGEFGDPATYSRLAALLDEVARAHGTGGNVLFWNRRYVDHVQMLVGETVGVEDRGNYYETAGVLRDMIQNHMFQLLALIAMEPPASFDPDAVRDEKVKVLKSIRPMRPEDVLTHTVRGQYGEGTLGGLKVPGYRAEPKVSPTSPTETYAALKLHVENWRWAGVPFYLRSGKRLARRDTEIMIQFRRPPLLLFDQVDPSQIEPNRLVLHIQPDEGIEIQMKAKQPGPTVRLNTVKLDFSYKDFGETGAATGYERLLYDGMTGDSTLFYRADMVETAWKIATPILDVWHTLPPRDFPNYAAGSWGPPAADALLGPDGRAWWISE